MLRNTFLALFATAVTAALTANVNPRAVIAHDAVVGFAETVPSGTMGQMMLKWKPKLKVFNGCVPFPAVDADGNTSGGLSPTGSSNGGCSSSTGQIYARATTVGSRYAIMYSWYMPKDEPSDGLGHRHDWENAVVWFDSMSTSANVVGMAVSQHGGYATSTSPNFDGNSPLVGYISYWPLDHQLIFTDTVGGTQPLIAWESLTSAAQTALQNTDFGSGNVPFKDSNFSNNLAKAAV